MLQVEQNYVNGIPQTAVSGFAPRGLGWHWTAGGTGRAGALWTIQHFVNTRLTVNASYHILLFREGKATVAMWIVPVSRAAHSMNPKIAYVPRVNSAREQARFTETRRILGARANDPNAGCIAIAFCGMPADLAVAMKDPEFVADVRQLERELRTHPAVIDRPNFGHGWIQPSNRYEMDAAHGGVDLLIASLYNEAPAPVEDDMTLTGFKPIVNRRVTLKAGATARRTPAFNPKAYDENKIVQHAAAVTRIAVAEVKGTNLTLANGSVFDASTRWLMTDSGSNENVFYHWRDIDKLVPIETVEVVKEVVKEVPTGITQAQVDAAVGAERKSWTDAHKRVSDAEIALQKKVSG